MNVILPPEEMPDEEYFKNKSISNSDLKLVARCPEQYKHFRLLGNEPKRTEAMEFGSLLHRAILEPDRFEREYKSDDFALKLGSRLTKAYKEAIKDTPEGLTLVKDESYRKIISIREKVMENRLARDFLSRGRAEHSIFWTCDRTKLTCKAKLDLLRDDGWIVDIKTTDNALFFERTAFSYRYHVQAAWYMRGAEALISTPFKFLFIVIDRDAPHSIRLVTFDDETINAGNREADRCLNIIRECLDTNVWPGYSTYVEEVSLFN